MKKMLIKNKVISKTILILLLVAISNCKTTIGPLTIMNPTESNLNKSKRGFLTFGSINENKLEPINDYLIKNGDTLFYSGEDIRFQLNSNLTLEYRIKNQDDKKNSIKIQFIDSNNYKIISGELKFIPIKTSDKESLIIQTDAFFYKVSKLYKFEILKKDGSQPTCIKFYSDGNTDGEEININQFISKVNEGYTTGIVDLSNNTFTKTKRVKFKFNENICYGK